MWLRPSVTHIKGTGRSAAFRGPGSEGGKKGKRDSLSERRLSLLKPEPGSSASLMMERSLGAVGRWWPEALRRGGTPSWTREKSASGGRHFLVIWGVSPPQNWKHGETKSWFLQPFRSEKRSRSRIFITRWGIACFFVRYSKDLLTQQVIWKILLFSLNFLYFFIASFWFLMAFKKWENSSL